MKYHWIKLNTDPVKIEFRDYRPPEQELLMEPCVEWKGNTYYFKDLMRTKNNPWVGNLNYPDFIDCYDPYNIEPLHFEILDGYAVNIYQCEITPDEK